ncbi:MAG: hypothetical protein AAF997_21260 [Myxococcota bacterium]
MTEGTAFASGLGGAHRDSPSEVMGAAYPTGSSPCCQHRAAAHRFHATQNRERWPSSVRFRSSRRRPGLANVFRSPRAGAHIVFESDGHSISVPIDGTQVDATTPRGERAKASFDAKSARLSLTTVGYRTDTYRINESGQLVIHVKLTNSRLTQPIAFSTAYSRTK